MSARSLSRLPFDAREERVIAGLARWMGLLGRFQIVSAVFVFVVLLGTIGVITAAELVEPADEGGVAEEPLVSIGEVPRGSVTLVVAASVGFCLVFLRGGMLLISGAEDLDTVVSAEGLSQEDLESALGRLKSYFILESCLMIALAAGAYASTIAGWGG